MLFCVTQLVLSLLNCSRTQPCTLFAFFSFLFWLSNKRKRVRRGCSWDYGQWWFHEAGKWEEYCFFLKCFFVGTGVHLESKFDELMSDYDEYKFCFFSRFKFKCSIGNIKYAEEFEEDSF